MKNKVLTTRIMAMMMVAAMTMSAAPAVYAAERADSETIKEDNQPTEETADASEEEDASEGETRTEYPLTITTYDYDGNEIETIYEKAPEKVIAVYQGSIETMLALGLEDRLVATAGLDNEVPDDLIRDSRIFHFGTLSSTHQGVREATRHAIQVAKDAGCIITFDPNLRPPLWNSLEDARKEIEYGLTKCDVLKISDNEVEFLFDTTDYDKGAALIEETYHIPLVLITMGKDGSRAYYKGRRVECAPFLQEHTIETTGAGDTFCASILNYVLDHGLEDLTDENLMEMLTFANAGASLITTRKGALRVMPSREEVEEFIAKSGR